MVPQNSSGVWKCLKMDGDKIKCKNCDSEFKDFKNTTNLLKLKKAHPHLLESWFEYRINRLDLPKQRLGTSLVYTAYLIPLYCPYCTKRDSKVHTPPSNIGVLNIWFLHSLILETDRICVLHWSSSKCT